MLLTINTKNKEELIDITSQVKNFVKRSKIKNGLCNIYVKHATAALTINENADPNILVDILKTLEKIVPENDNYLHNRMDGNATSHIKSSILGCSLTIPFENNSLQLGQWQGIFLVELDGPKERNIILNIVKIE